MTQPTKYTSPSPTPSHEPAGTRPPWLSSRRNKLVALTLGVLVVFLAVWWLVDETEAPVAERPVIEAAHTEETDGLDAVELAADALTEFGIEVRVAGPGTLVVEKDLPGEVRANEDRYAHVTPRVAGIVRSVSARVGSAVRAGQTLAVIESRELADLAADYLAALEREDLARSSFEREERLYTQEITSQADFLEARQELAEARIRTRSARQKLIALGFSDGYLEALPNEDERSLLRYPLTAPISGRIVEKHIVPGEAIEAETDAFEIADLSTVWVDLSIYQRDLGVVREGQDVVIAAAPGQPRTRGTISYVRPVVGEETRTAIARAVIPNPAGLLLPGQFVTGLIAVGEVEVAIVVPATAVLDVEGVPTVFVQAPDGPDGHLTFMARPVGVGDRTADQVSITSGLAAGDVLLCARDELRGGGPARGAGTRVGARPRAHRGARGAQARARGVHEAGVLRARRRAVLPASLPHAVRHDHARDDAGLDARVRQRVGGGHAAG